MKTKGYYDTYTHIKLIIKTSIYCAFILGLRIGEVLALEVKDIDFENNCIHISRTTTRDKEGHVILGPCPKTGNGERDIIITELIRPILKDAITNRNYSAEGLLFCKTDGSVYTDSALNSCLKRVCEKAGIETRAHNHRLRKNFNTRGVEAGVDYKVLEDNAGHSDIHILLDTYVDAQRQFKEQEMQKYVEAVKNIVGDVLTQT
ncbi:MAG: site-specific integrase [Clostridia bacterium]|nr:site-specific integrase [Clostridia bacterium]